MHSRDAVAVILQLLAEGMSPSEAARATGVPRRTIVDWKNGRTPRVPSEPDGACATGHDVADRCLEAYLYLLGAYLGDGCLSAHRRGVWKLRITLDAEYPWIIEECAVAIEAGASPRRAHIYRRPGQNCVDVSAYWKHWQCLFPQDGRGKKHTRQIVLAPWQEELVARRPEPLIRGLIHTDGCRFVAHDVTRGVQRDYARYVFSNLSEDIKRIFCAALDSLGIHWTRASRKDIAIATRAGVAALDVFVGPKL